MSAPLQELPGGMASTGIGERLRSARQALGLSLEEIENVTRIRRSFLVALEQETFDVLPGPAYVRGFLRTYAAYLGIPLEELLELYPSPSTGAKAGTIVHRESPVEVRITPAIRLSPTRRVLVGVAMLVGLGVVALGVVLYGQIRQFAETPASSLGPSKPSTTPSSGAPRSTPPAPPSAQVPPRAAPPKPPPAAPPPLPTPSPAPAIPPKPPAAPSPYVVPGPTPTPAKPGTPPGPGATGGTAAPPAPGKVPGFGPAPPSSPKAAPLHVAVAASGHSWVRTVADGTTVFEGFVNAGDKQIWEAKRTLTVKVGNASAVDLSLNGKSLGRLGASGEVYEHTFSAGPPPP
jgi:cytoskeleton protein RodZ